MEAKWSRGFAKTGIRSRPRDTRRRHENPRKSRKASVCVYISDTFARGKTRASLQKMWSNRDVGISVTDILPSVKSIPFVKLDGRWREGNGRKRGAGARDATPRYLKFFEAYGGLDRIVTNSYEPRPNKDKRPREVKWKNPPLSLRI